MEKLQDLISEFINKTILPYNRGAECIKFENGYFYFRDGDCLIEDTIISNRYGFIKRLVENDKIDRDKFQERKSDYNAYFTGELTKEEKSELVISADILTMLLSISSSPIEDLISYLK